MGGGDSLSSSPDEDDHATIRTSRTNRPVWPILLASGFGLAVGCAGVPGTLPLAHERAREAKREMPVVQAFSSETPLPAGPEFLKHIEKTKITADGHTLTWTKGTETFQVNLPKRCPQSVDGFCDLGLMKRDGKVFRLLYTARVQFGPARAAGRSADDQLWPTLVSRPGQNPARGRPAGRPARPGAVVKVYPEDKDPVELKTDADGHIDYPGIAQGRTALLVKWTEKMPGKLDDKPFDEIRHYATLTVDPAGAPTTAEAAPPPSRCSPRPSTALAGPSSAIGYTSTAGTPGPRTSIIREPPRNTSAD